MANASNLGDTKNHSTFIVVGIITLIVLASSMMVAITETSSTCVDGKQYLCPSLYKPAPKGLLMAGEIEFNRLGTSNLSLVRVTPARAVRVADAQYGRVRSARITFESLGGYIDKDAIVHDSVGTTSWKTQQPSRRTWWRISGVNIASLGPRPGVRKGSWNVIVNAINGKVIAAITYD